MDDRKLITFDYAIKYLLRGKDSYDLLGGFLSELMSRHVVVDSLLGEETNKIDKEEKINRVDIKAKIDDGEIAVFEIQFHQESDFFGKVLFGTSKALTEQVGEGEEEYFMRKVYSINVVFGNRVKAKREYMFHGKFSGFRGVHFEDEPIIPFAQIPYKGSKEHVEIHPEYYLILPDMFDETLRGKFDEWIYVLKRNEVKDEFTAAGIAEARVKLKLMNLPKDKRAEYEKYLEARRSLNSVTYAAEEDGFEKGKAQGIAQGIAQGKAQGKAEIVLNMHNEGLSIETIVKVSKLTETEVNNILETETDNTKS
jgi:hypothetical protein